ncbi:MAG: lytic transglycosylase domain-containing protein [Armatimonadetes bacterium]|jgi:soluble lytic murein transglycosylase-like protein|nr:lytic transglycosylase domain-containing protein [Armatimonadota bacterium]
MLARLSRVEARVHEIQERLSALAPEAAAPSSSFEGVLAAAQASAAPGPLPPAPVEAAIATGDPPPLSPPPRWAEPAADAHAETQGAAAVIAAALRHGVDPTLAAAVARAESGFNPRAVSAAGAQGLMQLMPDTAQALGVADPFDAVQNADGGVRYLAEQLQRFGDVPRALAAYNAGPSRVARLGTVPPIPETQHYVRRVLEYQRQYREAGLP